MCDSCANGEHCNTPGCTCQHRPLAQTLGVVGIESGEAVGDIGA